MRPLPYWYSPGGNVWAIPGDSACIGRFADDTPVSVVLGITSFTNPDLDSEPEPGCGWNSEDQLRAVESAVERSIHRRQTTTGIRVRFRYDGRVAKGSPLPNCRNVDSAPGVCSSNVALNEIVVVCSRAKGVNPLAESNTRISADFGSVCTVKPIVDRGVIVFYKYKDAASPANENPWTFGHPAGSGSADMASVMAHELGHAYGLMHPCERILLFDGCAQGTPEDQTIRKRQLMFPSLGEAWPWNRTGPQTPDITRMKSAWAGGVTSLAKLERRDSGDGVTWTAPTTVSTVSWSYHSPAVRRSPSTTFGEELYAVSASRTAPNTVELRYSSNGTTWNTWQSFSGMTTDHQPALAVDGNEVMVAAIDKTFDHTAGAGRRIKVRRSADSGVTFAAVTDIVANTASRIEGAVTKTSDGVHQLWHFAWVDAETFEAKLAVSTNDGGTWWYRTFGIVTSDAPSIACNGANTCQIAFRAADAGAAGWYRHRARDYRFTILAGIPLLAQSGDAQVEVSNALRGGMPARIVFNPLGPTAWFDLHAVAGVVMSAPRETRLYYKTEAAAVGFTAAAYIGGSPISVVTNHDPANLAVSPVTGTNRLHSLMTSWRGVPCVTQC